jgi:hypothetical protein
LKFCKSCGANLHAVRQVVATRDTGEKFDWTKTWVAEMFMSGNEVKRRQEELERQRGITPEVKRLREIKAGIITASAGVGLAVFLFVFMQGIIAGGNVAPAAAEILSRLWVTGVIPFCVGLGLIVAGILVRPKAASLPPDASQRESQPPLLEAGGAPEFGTPRFSVTDQTTKQLTPPKTE